MTSQTVQRVRSEDSGHVLDMASLMLRRMNAVPIRLKILLDRLLSTLHHERVQAILHQCGWDYDDYARGYKLQVTFLYTLMYTGPAAISAVFLFVSAISLTLGRGTRRHRG